MDLRGFISLCEKEGELKRVKAEVDWDLEISHICKARGREIRPGTVVREREGV